MKTDLSNILTVFILTCGKDPNIDDCLTALKNQTVTFKIDIIKDYSPLNMAFNEMIIRCKTDYYIECDSDMVLYDDAIRLLYNSIKNTSDKCVMTSYMLTDVHLKKDIYGIKIYKHNIFKQYPYKNELSCEMGQLEKLQKDGYTYKLFDEVIGKHSPKWTNETIFHRYKDLMEKFKTKKYVWLEDLPKKLLEKYKQSHSDIDLYAFLGAYNSIISDNIQEEEKDYTKYRTKEIAILDSYVHHPISCNLYMTNKCQLNCDFCFRTNKEIEQAPDLTIGVVADVLFRYPFLQNFCIAGYGEPLLCEHFTGVLQYLKEQNKFVGLITNGIALPTVIPYMKKNLPDYISVSIKAHNKEEYIKVTGKDYFGQMITGIKASVEAGVKTYCSYICTRESIKFVPEILKLVKSISTDIKIHLINLLSHFKNDDNFKKLVLTKEDEYLIKEIKQHPDSNMIECYPVLIDFEGKNNNCKSYWDVLGINGNKSLTGCNSIFPPDKNNCKITDNLVWQGEYYQNKRREIIENKMPLACKYCFRNY